jgi:phospholipid N-methyltransferase
MKTISPERIRQLLHYNPHTGVFTNKVTRGRANNAIAGTRAGTVNDFFEAVCARKSAEAKQYGSFVPRGPR